MLALADTSDHILDNLVNAETTFAETVANLKLEISPNGVIVTSRRKVSKQLAEEVAHYSVKMVFANT